MPEFQEIIRKIKKGNYCRLGDIVTFSNDTTDFSEFDDVFPYLEISGVELQKNSYSTTLTKVDKAPSRAKMKTQIGDIVISTTRPHRGAIAEIKAEHIIASTGFAIIRCVDDRINKNWLIQTLLSDCILKQFLQRSSGGNYPAIIQNEIEKVFIPIIDLSSQEKNVFEIEAKLLERNEKIKKADNLIAISKKQLFESLGIDLPPFVPTILSCVKSKELLSTGWYCNSHSFYLDDVFRRIKESSYYAGTLEDYAYINPSINKRSLTDSTPVSFVPMNAVSEKTNSATYELTEYSNVKTGFTPFQKNDLLWAKITPCMQNGKSFFADNLPTQYGFASTEFHVIRAKRDDIYMPFLWCILSNDSILEAAQGMFSGSAGQQRVSETFLKRLPIVLPSMEMQKELADNVMNALEESKKLRDKAEQDWIAAKAQFEKELLGD